MKTIATLFGIACGAFDGLALGIVAAIGLGYRSRWTDPNDPSAFSVAIVVIFTAPAGAVLGAVLGGLTIAARPRVFLATFLPLAIVFVSIQATLSALRAVDRPRTFVLEVDGTHDAEYFGIVSVDGGVQTLKGDLPSRFEFKGLRIDLAFALIHANEVNRIAVRASADGRDLETGIESETGVHQQLKSFGVSEFFGGTSSTWSRMSPEEVAELIEEQVMPREMLEL